MAAPGICSAAWASGLSASPYRRLLCRHLFRFRGAVVSSVAAAQEALPVEFLWGEQLEHLPPQVLPNLNDR